MTQSSSWSLTGASAAVARTGPPRAHYRAGLAHAGVGVQTADPDVDPDDVEQQAAEADQLDVARPAAPPAGRGPGVQEHRVDNPGDERPRLLGIPAPVAAPGVVSPDGPGHHPEGPNREREQDAPVGQPVQNRGGGHVPEDAGRPGRLASRESA